jgi:hypothetical protein
VFRRYRLRLLLSRRGCLTRIVLVEGNLLLQCFAEFCGDRFARQQTDLAGFLGIVAYPATVHSAGNPCSPGFHSIPILLPLPMPEVVYDIKCGEIVIY